jgi:hypothetical protein
LVGIEGATGVGAALLGVVIELVVEGLLPGGSGAAKFCPAAPVGAPGAPGEDELGAGRLFGRVTPGAGVLGDMVGAVAGPDGLAVDPEGGAPLAPPLEPPEVCASADPAMIETTPMTAASVLMLHLTRTSEGNA